MASGPDRNRIGIRTCRHVAVGLSTNGLISGQTSDFGRFQRSFQELLEIGADCDQECRFGDAEVHAEQRSRGMQPTIHLRAETRNQERRAALIPSGAAELIRRGFTIVVEESRSRVFPIENYAEAGCRIASTGSWVVADGDCFILGLKELPESPVLLKHRHIMFGHAFKRQPDAEKLLKRFRSGGGTLYDLEYITDDNGTRLAAFGFWAGYAGAAIALMAWSTAQSGIDLPDLTDPYPSRSDLRNEVARSLRGTDNRPNVIIVGMGRTGSGARDLCASFGLEVTEYDIEETASGGPFLEILQHDIFLNCVLTTPITPRFLNLADVKANMRLRIVGDIACDPGSPFNPVPIYDHVTSFAKPATRVNDNPPMDVIAIDNLPSMLPEESSLDFSEQLLPQLAKLGNVGSGVWYKAQCEFEKHIW